MTSIPTFQQPVFTPTFQQPLFTPTFRQPQVSAFRQPTFPRPPIGKCLEMKDAKSAVIIYEHKDGSEVTVRIPNLTNARLIYWQEGDNAHTLFSSLSSTESATVAPIITKKSAASRIHSAVPGQFFFKNNWLEPTVPNPSLENNGNLRFPNPSLENNPPLKIILP